MPANLTLVPIDFETTTLDAALRMASAFDTSKRSVASWLNTIPYLTKEAVRSTLVGLAEVMAPSSALVFNYACNVALSDEARAMVDAVKQNVIRRGEPFRSRYEVGEMEETLATTPWVLEQQLTEADFAERFFRGRVGALRPVTPARLIIARRRDDLRG